MEILEITSNILLFFGLILSCASYYFTEKKTKKDHARILLVLIIVLSSIIIKHSHEKKDLNEYQNTQFALTGELQFFNILKSKFAKKIF